MFSRLFLVSLALLQVLALRLDFAANANTQLGQEASNLNEVVLLFLPLLIITNRIFPFSLQPSL